MKNIISKLENTSFKGILIKKGSQLISDTDFNKLNESLVFKNQVKFGHIIVKETPEPTTAEPTTAEPATDFDKMSYKDLKEYVKVNNIETKSMSKADILKAIKGE